MDLDSILNKIVYELNKIVQTEQTNLYNCAVIFDIDNTLISNEGQPINSVIALYNYVKTLNLIPVIITNRIGTLSNVRLTQQQFQKHGILGYNSMYFRKTEDSNPWWFKLRARQDVFKRGMKIIMSIGDMPWDIGDYGGLGVLLPTSGLPSYVSLSSQTTYYLKETEEVPFVFVP